MRYIVVSISSGILFGIMDGIINANPIASKLYEVYSPIARKEVSFSIGIILDLVYGFVIAGVYTILYKCIPGQVQLIKGISFALILWFLRVFMYVASQGMMFNIPITTLLYILFTGLGEMLVLGVFYSLTLRP